MMRIPRRDVIATGLVAAAAVLYVLWLADLTLPGIKRTRATGIVILGLGSQASATAVVPNTAARQQGVPRGLVAARPGRVRRRCPDVVVR